MHSYLHIKITLGMLSAIILVLICPVVPDEIHAEGEVIHDVDSVVSANINSAVSVALQSRVDIDVLPEGKNTFNYQTAKLTITTNSVDGYSIYLYTNETTANLVNPEDYNARITPVNTETGSTPTTFATNTWGYNLSETGISNDSIFSAVPLATDAAAQAAVQKTNTTAKADTYNLSFGVNVAPDLPAGQYSSNVVVSVVVNPSQIRSLTQLTYMQDMTDAICKNTAPRDTDNTEIKNQYMKNPVEKQLIDIRDGKKYWVAKLADGNCWMTQNLALTLKDFNDGEGVRAMAKNGGKGAQLTSNNTDIIESWTAGSTVPPLETKVKVATSFTAGTAGSWNLGDYVLATPTQTTACPNQAATVVDPLSQCKTVGFVDVSDETKWVDNFQITSGYWDEQGQLITVMLNEQNDVNQGGSYDAHYLVGNYYTYAAAVAGSKTDSVTANPAPYSICPKGWKLPAYANFESTGNYAYLLRQYGLATSNTAGKIIGQGIDGETYNVATSPLSFFRSGRISNSGGYIYGAANGYYRTPSTHNGGNDTYQMTITGATLSPTLTTDSYSRFMGESIRCLAK